MSLRKILKTILPKPMVRFIQSFGMERVYLKELRELTLDYQTHIIQSAHINPLNRFGKKCFSQADEDGITLEILRRINALETPGTFAEFGVGDGTENNTLILKAMGWKGFWVGGEDLAFEIKQPPVQFTYFKSWITLENITQLSTQGQKNLEVQALDVMSLDLDGNDIYFVEKLLSTGFLPKLFIVEYNAKFPPPVQWQIIYDAQHTWQGDDYFGASLTSYAKLFEKYGFFLACCNAQTGSNAFFVRNDFRGAFQDVPDDLNSLYVPPRYHVNNMFGHKPAIKTIAHFFVNRKF